MNIEELREEIQHKRTLQNQSRKRLRILEEQRAGFGELYVPAHIRVDIDNIEQDMLVLDREIEKLQEIEWEYENFRHKFLELISLMDMNFRNIDLEYLKTRDDGVVMYNYNSTIGECGKITISSEDNKNWTAFWEIQNRSAKWLVTEYYDKLKYAISSNWKIEIVGERNGITIDDNEKRIFINVWHTPKDNTISVMISKVATRITEEEMMEIVRELLKDSGLMEE